MKRTLICIILSICMLLSLLSGCASEPAEETQEPASSQGAEAPASQEPASQDESGEDQPEPEASQGTVITTGNITYTYTEIPLPLTEEPITLTMTTDFLPPLFAAMSGMEENSVYIELERLTGIHLDITSVSITELSTSTSLTVASGEYPDLWFSFLNSYSGTVDSAINDEVIYDLAQFKEYMPNYFSIIDGNEELKKSTYTDDGYMGQAYGVFEEPLSTQGLAIREDWLEDLGLETPVTYDDYHQTLTAFKDNYNATYWMNSAGEQYFSAGLNTGASFLVQNDQVYYGAVTDEYREYLDLMRQWYSEGLIWQEFATSSESMDETKAGQGEYGIFDISMSKYTNILSHAQDPDFLLAAVTPPVENPGDIIHVGQKISALGNKGMSLSTHCPDEYLEIACQWLDYWYTPEGSMLANYGVEGEAYNLVDGQVVWTDLMLNNPDLNFTWAMNKYCMGSGAFIMNGTRIYNDYDDVQWEMMDVFNCGYSDYAYTMPTISLTAEESEEYSALYSDIETYISEHYMLFIMGELPMSEFDGFVTEIENLGIARCIQLQQAAYDRYMSR